MGRKKYIVIVAHFLMYILQAKVEKKDMASQISDLTALTNCNNFIFFETRKKKDLYMWMGKDPNGPTVKFLVENSTL